MGIKHTESTVYTVSSGRQFFKKSEAQAYEIDRIVREQIDPKGNAFRSLYSVPVWPGDAIVAMPLARRKELAVLIYPEGTYS